MPASQGDCGDCISRPGASPVPGSARAQRVLIFLLLPSIWPAPPPEDPAGPGRGSRRRAGCVCVCRSIPCTWRRKLALPTPSHQSPSDPHLELGAGSRAVGSAAAGSPRSRAERGRLEEELAPPSAHSEPRVCHAPGSAAWKRRVYSAASLSVRLGSTYGAPGSYRQSESERSYLFALNDLYFSSLFCNDYLKMLTLHYSPAPA